MSTRYVLIVTLCLSPSSLRAIEFIGDDEADLLVAGCMKCYVVVPDPSAGCPYVDHPCFEDSSWALAVDDCANLNECWYTAVRTCADNCSATCQGNEYQWPDMKKARIWAAIAWFENDIVLIDDACGWAWEVGENLCYTDLTMPLIQVTTCSGGICVPPPGPPWLLEQSCKCDHVQVLSECTDTRKKEDPEHPRPRPTCYAP